MMEKDDTIPTAWYRFVGGGSPGGIPQDVDVECIYGDDQPSGEGWWLLYAKPYWKFCHICHAPTDICCSDCAINFGASVYGLNARSNAFGSLLASTSRGSLEGLSQLQAADQFLEPIEGTVRVEATASSETVKPRSVLQFDSTATPQKLAAADEHQHIDLILGAWAQSEIEPEARQEAIAAAKDALIVLSHWNIPGEPRASFSDDGSLTLIWERGLDAAALIFIGDHVVATARWREGRPFDGTRSHISVFGRMPEYLASPVV